MPRSFFAMLAAELNSVLPYVGENLGQSFSADKYWKEKKDKIPDDVIEALKKFSSAGKRKYQSLEKMLDC